MKKFKLIFLTLSAIFFASLTAKAQWTNLWNNNIYGVCFATSADTCYTTGGSGQIFRTSNGGLTWDTMQTVFYESFFNDILFPSANIGYACGGSAFGIHKCTIVKTTNAGQTWDSVTSNTSEYEFNKIFFVNDTVGFFSGCDFLKTTDGCQTFSTITHPFLGMINSIYFFNDSVGLIAINEYVNSTKTRYRIARTTDAGLNWTTNYLDSTNNSSTIWNSKSINDIDFINSSVGFAVRDNGMYLQSANGGISWTPATLTNDSTNLKNIAMSKTSGVGYIACWKYTGTAYQSRIYKTIDFGFTWQTNFNTSFDGFYSISMATDETVYAGGYGYIFKTTNGGATSINENNFSENDFIVYPNPFNGELTIQINSTQVFQFTLYNSLGDKIIDKSLTKKNSTIDLSAYSNGIYFYKLTSDKQLIKSGKIIKQ